MDATTTMASRAVTVNPETTIEASAPRPDAARVRRLVEEFLLGRSPRTTEAYRRDLRTFAAFLGVLGTPPIEDAARRLLSLSHGEANELILRFRNHLAERGMAPATINRHLAAIRSLVALGKTLGIVPWTIAIRGVKNAGMRDTRGPGVNGVRRMLRAVEARGDAKGARDAAIVRLAFDLALRRAEIASLDLEHVDLEGRRLAILGKGRTGREWRTLPAPTVEALKAWIDARGTEPGPLFVNFDHAKKGGRITGTSIWRIVRAAGEAVGLRTWPHAIRHCSISVALDQTGGDVRRVAKFSRHASIQTVLIYDDARADVAGGVADLVAKAL